MLILPKISVIVTTYNSSLVLEKCLQSIKNQSYKNVEIIVVDNNSLDNTVEIAKKYTSYIYYTGPERSAQRNYGINKSTGDFLVIIDSDMFLSESICEDVVIEFIKDELKLGLVIPEESFGIGFWANCKRLERKFYIGVDWMEAARAFRKNIILDLGGYDEENTGTEDYDLPHRIQMHYGQSSVGRIKSYIFHNEGNLSLIKTCYKKFYYSQKLGVYFKKKENFGYFIKQSSPIHRYILFFKSPILLFKNPILGMGMLYMKLCELLFGGLGFILATKNSSIKKIIYK